MGTPTHPPNNLRALREARGWTHEEAAERMGVSRGHFIKLERRERGLTRHTIDLASHAFSVEPDEVVRRATKVPVVGFVGAGGEAHFYSDGQALPDEEAARPPGSSPQTVALIARGASMPGIAEDGWLVYYDDRREPITDDLIGELCVVGLADGRVLIKKVYRGRRQGSFDLVSVAYETLKDQEIAWAAKVDWIKPR